MWFMASGAFELHRRSGWKSFSLELHRAVAAETEFLLRFEAGVFCGEKLMTGRAVKPRHATDVRALDCDTSRSPRVSV